MTPSDLPPIEDLHITVPEAECFQVGIVSSCVDDLVVVHSLQGMPALDLVNVFHKFLEMTRRTIPESTFWCAFQHDAMISHHPFIQSSSFRSELLSRSSKLNHAPISQTKQENRRNFCALSV